jgi:hypothetical protein
MGEPNYTPLKIKRTTLVYKLKIFSKKNLGKYINNLYIIRFVL